MHYYRQKFIGNGELEGLKEFLWIVLTRISMNYPLINLRVIIG